MYPINIILKFIKQKLIELGESDSFRITVGDFNITLSEVKNKQTNLLKVYSCTIQLRNLYHFSNRFNCLPIVEIVPHILPIKSFGREKKKKKEEREGGLIERDREVETEIEMQGSPWMTLKENQDDRCAPSTEGNSLREVRARGSGDVNKYL